MKRVVNSRANVILQAASGDTRWATIRVSDTRGYQGVVRGKQPLSATPSTRKYHGHQKTMEFKSTMIFFSRAVSRAHHNFKTISFSAFISAGPMLSQTTTRCFSRNQPKQPILRREYCR